MSIRETTKIAQDFGVSTLFAVCARASFLKGEITRLEQNVEWFLKYDYDEASNELAVKCAEISLSEMWQAVKKLKKIECYIAYLQQPPADRIDDEMIAVAKSYPINKLIEFKRGKACAPCHDDQNPSMYHGYRKNRAYCPVCDRSWGPIDWVMEFENVGFIEAVKRLNR